MKLGYFVTEHDIYEVYADPSLRCKTKYVIHYIRNGQPKDSVVDGLFSRKQLEDWEDIVNGQL